MSGTPGTVKVQAHLHRLRHTLEYMRHKVDDVVREYVTPSVGHRRDLHMSKLIDTILTVRPALRSRQWRF